jgi:hypothetical protein
MPAAVLCPRCQKRFRSENHVCQPTAIKKLKPLVEAQKRAEAATRQRR